MFRAIQFFGLLGLLAQAVCAQQVTPYQFETRPENFVAPVTEQVAQSELIPTEEETLKPFGFNLFNGGFTAEKEDGINPGYQITPGDIIELRVWGAAEQNEQLGVDPKGNIFVQKVGPIRVAGVRNDQLNQVVTAAIREVYTENVQVYTALVSSQPVAVFVTGYVANPGRFAGVASNSLLYYIDRAGGIDPVAGSYRDIRVLRRNRVIAKTDLYEFLLEGQLAEVQLRDGDTILVGSRGNVVTVTGDVRSSAEFELEEDTIRGAALLDLARANPAGTHAFWTGVREGEGQAGYLDLGEFRAAFFSDGDEITILSDRRDDTITVLVEGVFEGPSRYVVARGTRLGPILDTIPVIKGISAHEAISIRREGIYQRQKAILEESLRRLESAYLTASSSTREEAAIRVTEAGLIADFVRRAREVEPNGRLVLGNPADVRDLLLQQGDVISVPERTQTVLVSGEILIPQAVVFKENAGVEDYIDQAGGFTELANDENILILRQNGSAVRAENAVIRPSDQIMVLPKVPSKYLQFASEIVDITYKVAVSAGVLLGL